MRKSALILTISLLLVSALAAPNIIVSKSSSDPSPAQAGSDLFLTVLLQNYASVAGAYGVSAAQNVKVELETNSPFQLKVERERVIEFQMLCENCYKELDYHLFVESSAKSGTYPLKVKVSYLDAGSQRGLEYDVMVEVRNYKHTVGVSDVSISKDPLYPGDTANLDLTIKNYGVEDIKQVELTLTAPTNINIVGSTKRFFLEQLRSSKEVKVSYPIIVNSKAEMGAYDFPLSIKITDNYGNEQTFTDSIGVQVYAQPDIQFSVRSYDTSTGKISTLVANRGKATALYTMVKLEGVTGTPSEVYIGNLDSDDYSTADFTVTPQEGTAVLTVYYVDSNNAEKSITQNVQVHFIPQTNGTIYLAGGVVVVLAGLVYWFFFRNKKKEK